MLSIYLTKGKTPEGERMGTHPSIKGGSRKCLIEYDGAEKGREIPRSNLFYPRRGKKGIPWVERVRAT